MHADELRMAVTKVVELLDQADIASVVDQYRSAKGEQRSAANAQLRSTAKSLVDKFGTLKPAELQVAKILHLDALGSRQYWQNLFACVNDQKQHQGEIVRLASRIMFARNHLPGLLKLVSNVNSQATESDAAAAFAVQALELGEARLCIRLTDAGERASDPDRVARSIDGIDMLYSACASIARKPAMDLRIDKVLSKRNGDREAIFTGDKDSIAAVNAVIDSIPAALANIDTDQEIDLSAIVHSLPIFEDLNTLAALGTFSKQDLKDISDTMHQGALLTLESGVIPMDATYVSTIPTISPKTDRNTASADPAQQRSQPSRENNPAAGRAAQAAVLSTASSIEQDEHYDRYLKEREAMLRPAQESGAIPAQSSSEANGDAKNAAIDRNRREAVDDLLKSLGQSRGH